MASSRALVLNVFKSILGYVESFDDVYDARTIDIDQVTDAIATFEETLVTPNSKFYQWLLGNEATLSPPEKQGYDLFKQKGCIAYHNGAAMGGTMYKKWG